MSIGQYDYKGLVQTFIEQSQSKGKTASGRMSFESNRLYSYNSLLAKLDVSNKVLLIDKDISTYSKTSKHHTRILSSYVQSLSIFVIDFANTPKENLISYVENIEHLIVKYNRAKLTKHNYKQRIITQYHEATAYANYTNVDKRTTEYHKLKQVFAKLFELKLL